jgi:hypothetical protein
VGCERPVDPRGEECAAYARHVPRVEVADARQLGLSLAVRLDAERRRVAHSVRPRHMEDLAQRERAQRLEHRGARGRVLHVLDVELHCARHETSRQRAHVALVQPERYEETRRGEHGGDEKQPRSGPLHAAQEDQLRESRGDDVPHARRAHVGERLDRPLLPLRHRGEEHFVARTEEGVREDRTRPRARRWPIRDRAGRLPSRRQSRRPQGARPRIAPGRGARESSGSSRPGRPPSRATRPCRSRRRTGADVPARPWPRTLGP